MNLIENSQELLELIQASELNGFPPPPGIYAEYGYALYLRGQFDGAIVYFAKEQEAWPESAVLMTTVIGRLEGRIEEEKVNGEAVDDGVIPATGGESDTGGGNESTSTHEAPTAEEDDVAGVASASGGE